MGCCGVGGIDESEEPLRVRSDPGPPARRRCTDVPCCLLFVALLTGLLCLVGYSMRVGDLRRVGHGRDHDGNLCGIGAMADRPFSFFPDLERDAVQDPTLQKRYGLCVSSCPAPGTTVQDYGTKSRRAEWLAVQPSFPVFGRCVPYEQPANKSGTLLCAFPACDPSGRSNPTNPQQVCGLARDGTDKYWLLEKPDVSIQDGWRAEQADAALVDARTAMAASAPGSPEAAACISRVQRKTQTSIRSPDQGLSEAFLTSITSPVYTFVETVTDHLGLVLGLGAAGGALMSLAVLLMFPACAGPVLIVLLCLLFMLLIVSDYVLFVQSGIATGRTGGQFTSFLSSFGIDVPAGAADLLNASGDSSERHTDKLFAFAAFALAALIAFLLCMVLTMARQFKILIALLKEAGNVVRLVPTLVLLPLLMLASIAFFSAVLGAGVIGAVTARPEQVQATFESLHIQGDDALSSFQTAAGCCFLFGYIWLYFFHVAIFTNTIALTVSRWYFRGDLQEHRLCPSLGGCAKDLGGPVIVSLIQVFRYHLGSMAFGSLAMTVCTIPRIVLEYVDRHTKDATDQNALARTIMCVSKCLLKVLHCCLQFITEYAYIYVAVLGKNFCTSARQSFSLFAKYPTQVGLNELTSLTLGYLVSVVVPLSVAAVAFWTLQEDWLTYEYCAVAIIICAYVVSRMAVGVYDVVLTSLFVCAMRDEEYCGGENMSHDLRLAIGLRHGAREVEIP
eukprot:TRINITY_DN25848_c0_g1_i1.p1 TRINITY_DN25848_c0_g1~~TRINITY_DN25848_c0_g1_i1.p1  ORF type:complete len:731 (-),score=121.37 TRINITY_DN25848_c0_g1_i1:50-2242(-)